MRITNGMLTKNYIKNLNTNIKALDKYQTQLSSFKRITRLSDDPIGMLKSIQVRTRIYKTEQYQSTVDCAKTWLKDTETSLTEMNEVLKNAYEKTIDAANSYMTDSDKQSIAEYIGQLRDQALSIGNNRSGDKYIFGGYNTSRAPFTLDAFGKILYNGLDLSDASNADLIAENAQKITYEVGFGMKTDVSMTGSKLMSMGEDNIYAVLDGLYKTLMNNGSAEEIAAYTTKLQNCQSNVLSLEAESGGKTARLELLSNRYEQDIINYTSLKSSVEDVDVAEATLQYKMAESVYEAALAIGSSIIMPTLVDYLK
ncbi:MAG: flagellar hook-associated protein FlgL [Christensenellales bacterium]